MNHPPTLEEQLQNYGREFAYPPTPSIDRALHGRLGFPTVPRNPHLLRLGIAVLVIILAASLAVPGVRAQVLEFLRIGVVRIFPAPPAESTPVIQPTGTAPSPIPRTSTARPPLTPQLEPDYIISLEGLAGETTLEEAKRRVSFPILLPADLGEPDKVFLQQAFQMVILVWLEEDDPEKVRLSLHEVAPGSVTIEKFEPRLLQETQVNGHPAAWVKGPYLVRLTNGDISWRRMVEGNTLIWEAGSITYRLESGLTLQETLPIAESVR